MNTPLSTYTGSRDNNFNLIRFLAALAVLYSHSIILTLGPEAKEPLKSLVGIAIGSIAVDVFFVTSGFLIAASYLARKDIIAFTWARLLRIYPGLIVAIIFCVFVVGLYFTSLPKLDYITHVDTLKYFIKNCTLIVGVDSGLPGVFTETPYKYAVNGSLWTLPYEVRMYFLLALTLMLLGSLQSKWKTFCAKSYILVIAGTALVVNTLNYFFHFAPEKFTHLFYMFFSGSAYFICRDNIRLNYLIFLPLAAVLIVSGLSKPSFFICYLLTLPYLILFLAYTPSGKIKEFNKIGDYSYGLYIYAFPIQQILAVTIDGIQVGTMITLSFIFTSILAFLSWHLIEKKFLKMKNSYKRFFNWNG